MTEPQIKDAILSFLLENPTYRYTSIKFAEKFNLSEDELKKYIYIINTDHGNWVEILHGGFGFKFTLATDLKFVPNITKFIHEGGYTKFAENQLSAIKKQDNLYELTVTNLELSNAAAHDARLSANKAENRANIANRATIITTVTAVVVIIWELIKTLILKR
ncbi:hypothetical protein HHL17_30970 [Chitinophaga sp. G-6-1-13]|uniref:Uncharacterized protein n=1 Tax=Chitinophaga fulva TaxID=2728842 RepID=A0A848H1E9_9BACT|nr:hypothetical protein [Chitinophaga fulva]NML41648.1 hypothetical protein [Chitinophaga fulva]